VHTVAGSHNARMSAGLLGHHELAVRMREHAPGVQDVISMNRAVAVVQPLCVGEHGDADRRRAHPVHACATGAYYRRELCRALLPQCEELRRVVGDDRTVGLLDGWRRIVADEDRDDNIRMRRSDDLTRLHAPVDRTVDEPCPGLRETKRLDPGVGQLSGDGARCLIHDRIADERNAVHARRRKRRASIGLNDQRTSEAGIRARRAPKFAIPNHLGADRRDYDDRGSDTCDDRDAAGTPFVTGLADSRCIPAEAFHFRDARRHAQCQRVRD